MLPFSLEVNIGCWWQPEIPTDNLFLEILSGINVVIQHLDDHFNKVNINAFQTNKPISVFAWLAEVNYS